MYTFGHEPNSDCTHRKTKNGRTYYQNVVEAKLVTENGFIISLASKWMLNEDGQAKQDYEYKAAMRLFDKLKVLYPKIRICI